MPPLGHPLPDSPTAVLRISEGPGDPGHESAAPQRCQLLPEATPAWGEATRSLWVRAQVLGGETFPLGEGVDRPQGWGSQADLGPPPGLCPGPSNLCCL